MSDLSTRKFLNRRSFIRTAAIAAGLTAVAPLVAACGAPAASPTAAPAAPKATTAPAAASTTAPAAAATTAPAAAATTAPAAAATKPAEATKPAAAATTAPTAAAKPAASGSGAKLQWWTPQHFIPAVNDYIKASGEQAGAAKGFTVETQQYPWGDFNTKMAAAVEAKTLPDCMIGVSAKRDYDRKILVDLTDVYNKIDGEGKFYNVVNTGTLIKGKHWAIGTHIEPQMMYYRKSKLKEAGFDKAPENLADFLKFTKAATDPAKSMWGFGQQISDCPDGNNFFNSAVIRSFGANLQTADNKVAMGSPEFLEAIKWFTDLYKVHKVIPQGATAWDDTGNNKAWLGNQAACIFNSGSIANTMMTDAQYKDLLADTMFAPFPLKDKLGITMGGFNAFGVMTSSKNQDLAKEIVLYAMSKERYLGYMKAAQGMFFPSIEREAKEDFYTKDPTLSQFTNLLQYARQNYEPGEMSSWIAELADTWSFSRMLAPVATGATTPENAQKELVAKAETLKIKWDKVSQ